MWIDCSAGHFRNMLLQWRICAILVTACFLESPFACSDDVDDVDDVECAVLYWATAVTHAVQRRFDRLRPTAVKSRKPAGSCNCCIDLPLSYRWPNGPMAYAHNCSSLHEIHFAVQHDSLIPCSKSYYRWHDGDSGTFPPCNPARSYMKSLPKI